MNTGIEKVIDGGNGNTLLYTTLIAAAVANTLPTPFDGIYFSRQQKLKQDLQNGKISITQYWHHDVGEYYLWTSLWYVSLIGAISLFGDGSFKTNAKILMALVSGGLVLGVMQNNIRRDNEIKQLSQNNSA